MVSHWKIPKGEWELHHGQLQRNQRMAASHNQVGIEPGLFNRIQWIDRRASTVRVNSGRAKRADETYYIPDVFIVPTRLVAPQLGRTDMLEVYERHCRSSPRIGRRQPAVTMSRKNFPST